MSPSALVGSAGVQASSSQAFAASHPPGQRPWVWPTQLQSLPANLCISGVGPAISNRAAGGAVVSPWSLGAGEPVRAVNQG